MVDITRADIDILVQLQKAETDTVNIRAFLQNVEAEKSALEDKLNEFKSAHEKLVAEFDIAEKSCSAAELEMKSNEERIEKSTQTLKTLANHKAYAALQREVDDNKKRRDSLENSYIELLDEKESRATALEEHFQQLQQLTEQIRSQQEEIDEKSRSHRLRMKEYEEERQKIAVNLAPWLLKQFNEISETSGGLAVVEVKDQLCRGCFMNIPPQLYIEVRRCKTLILCPQCNRILYYNE
ncbi:putative nucleic acid-binding Zn-ribbon protein [Desulfamplus magnetovallimortis]|uniref:Putative nucleic acid-binding Zn-ribbon protein n=1 Tax=Desulfamplus magnetovallimortis TaxID=1246637 RepID=L0R5J5_9BACT|nr:C4-type zinc ribbon domain-containing protein [Desulfamplus magnetovallimortis]CCO06792.1 putative nucleic acid-binding Zn-ribbon protein [Desulfamplus magnetovallimortis BW-1]SLM32843.1 putative nucleic acid-binding Zn-ribbon protein [Desulfamplus magnetovallimortis]